MKKAEEEADGNCFSKNSETAKNEERRQQRAVAAYNRRNRSPDSPRLPALIRTSLMLSNQQMVSSTAPPQLLDDEIRTAQMTADGRNGERRTNAEKTAEHDFPTNNSSSRRWLFRSLVNLALLAISLLHSTQYGDAAGQVVIKRFSKDQCKFNPCLNGGKCVAGKTACECPAGWMGKYCHRRCRNIYQSCDRWAMEEKCELVRTQTNFFDINCAVSCQLCSPDPTVKLTPIPLPPALEPLQFMMGKWYSQATKGLRYPTDMLTQEYEELLDISPTQVPMFGPPSLNLTSTCWYKHGGDIRITHGFMTLKPNSNPPEVAILSTANEGLNMIELGTLQNHAVTLNISYMQVHPSLDNDVLPLGATRRFKRNGQFLEMTVAKLFPNSKVSQFKKMFKKVRNYPF